MTRLLVASGGLTIVLAIGCGGGATQRQKAGAPDQDVHAYDPCAGGDATFGTVTCDGWAAWPQINAETFQSEGHQSAWVDVHVDAAYADAYRAGVGPMPVGMRIVKAAHADAGKQPGEVTGLTVMAKMEPGYDPDNGDWYYGVYDPTGTIAKKQGKLDMCIGCHGQWTDHDYLGGVPGLWAE
jgi:hypothetical protein